MVRIFMRRFRGALFLVLITFLTSNSLYAYNADWNTTAIINWNVTGANDCNGITNYPSNAGDGISSTWGTNHPSSGYINLGPIKAAPATYTFTCTNAVTGATDSDTLVVSCPAGTSWNGSSCVVPAPTGSFNPVPADCTIANGASSCTTSLTWSVTNATTTVYVKKDGTTIYTGASGSGSGTVPHGSATFTLLNGSTLLDTETVNGTCVAGTSWDTTSGTCKAPTGSFSGAADCTIVSGSSTCSTTFGWTTSYSTTTVNVQRNGTNLYSGTSGSNQKGSVSYGTNLTTFTLVTGGYTLDTETVSGTCTSTTTWDSANGRCWGADLVAGNAIPTTATVGATTTLSARITNSGKYTTGTTFNNFIQVASAANGGGTVQDLGYTTMTALASGAGATTSKSYSFTSSGTKSIRACADKSNSGSAGTIAESNESNNCGSWVNVVVSNPAPTGAFSGAADCTIVSGSSTCSTTFGWTTSYSTTTVNVQRNGTNLYSGTSGSNQKGSVSYGTNLTTFTLVTGGYTLDTETVSGVCEAGSTWDSGANKCVGLCLNGADNPPDCDHGNIMTGTINASPASCLIATGATTCTSHLSWSTIYPQGTSAVTRDGTPGNLYTGNNNADQITSVPFELDGDVIYRLYNNTLELDTVTVNVACAAGEDKWDTDNNECADPTVISVKVNGQYGYGGSGSIEFVCSNSTSYELIRDLAGDAEVISSGTYTTTETVPVTVSDNYSVICKHGSVSSDPTTVHYDTPPPPSPLIFINATPKTMNFQGKSAVNWVVQYPDAMCLMSAKPVCTGECTQAQNDAAAVLNNIINTENTDTDDQGNGGGGTRSIQTAVSTIAPGHDTTDYKALGKKTFTVTKSTDFTIDCGSGNTATTRVRITDSNEQ